MEIVDGKITLKAENLMGNFLQGIYLLTAMDQLFQSTKRLL